MCRQLQGVAVLITILIGCICKANGLSCYYCYETSGCADPINKNSGYVSQVNCYSNATACSKIVLTGGATVRGCSTSCTATSDYSGTAYCCSTDYCNCSVRYTSIFSVILLSAACILLQKARLTS